MIFQIISIFPPRFARFGQGERAKMEGASGRKFLSRWSGLNRRPIPYHGIALPLSYIGTNKNNN